MIQVRMVHARRKHPYGDWNGKHADPEWKPWSWQYQNLLWS